MIPSPPYTKTPFQYIILWIYLSQMGSWVIICRPRRRRWFPDGNPSTFRPIWKPSKGKSPKKRFVTLLVVVWRRHHRELDGVGQVLRKEIEFEPWGLSTRHEIDGRLVLAANLVEYSTLASRTLTYALRVELAWMWHDETSINIHSWRAGLAIT